MAIRKEIVITKAAVLGVEVEFRSCYTRVVGTDRWLNRAILISRFNRLIKIQNSSLLVEDYSI